MMLYPVNPVKKFLFPLCPLCLCGEISFRVFGVFRGPKSSFGENLLAHFCEGSYIMKWSMTVTGSNRVNRGGSWNNIAENCRAAYRNNDDPGNRNHNLGFRLLSTRSCQRVWFTDHARVL
jgi:hypothetical protein